jgi:ribonuclease D
MRASLPTRRSTPDPLMFEVNHKLYETSYDLGEAFLKSARQRGVAALDIETSGLDWRSQRIGLCQVYVPGFQPVLIKTKKGIAPPHLLKLLADNSVQKIFHHAMFDLRFLAYHWLAVTDNVVCTKIASKTNRPGKS